MSISNLPERRPRPVTSVAAVGVVLTALLFARRPQEISGVPLSPTTWMKANPQMPGQITLVNDGKELLLQLTKAPNGELNIKQVKHPEGPPCSVATALSADEQQILKTFLESHLTERTSSLDEYLTGRRTCSQPVLALAYNTLRAAFRDVDVREQDFSEGKPVLHPSSEGSLSATQAADLRRSEGLSAGTRLDVGQIWSAPSDQRGSGFLVLFTDADNRRTLRYRLAPSAQEKLSPPSNADPLVTEMRAKEFMYAIAAAQVRMNTDANRMLREYLGNQ
jgi:hypothetical protein